MHSPASDAHWAIVRQAMLLPVMHMHFVGAWAMASSLIHGE